MRRSRLACARTPRTCAASARPASAASWSAASIASRYPTGFTSRFFAHSISPASSRARQEPVRAGQPVRDRVQDLRLRVQHLGQSRDPVNLGHRVPSWRRADAWNVRASTPSTPEAGQAGLQLAGRLLGEGDREDRRRRRTRRPATWCAMRWVIVVVLPVPAPARIATGPRTASAARRCASFSPARGSVGRAIDATLPAGSDAIGSKTVSALAAAAADRDPMALVENRPPADVSGRVPLHYAALFGDLHRAQDLVDSRRRHPHRRPRRADPAALRGPRVLGRRRRAAALARRRRRRRGRGRQHAAVVRHAPHARRGADRADAARFTAPTLTTRTTTAAPRSKLAKALGGVDMSLRSAG